MKRLSLLLIIVILTQGCTVYQKTSVTPYKAYGYGKVEVESNDGTIIRYKNIKLHKGAFYGVKGKTEIPLDMEKIKAIYLYDIEKSSKATATIMWIAIPVVLVAAFCIIFFSTFTVSM